MCGRFSLNTTLEELNGRLAPWLTRIDDPWLEHYAPRAQIRPGEPVLVLYREHGQERLGHMLWGLRPGWVKDPSEGPRPFNARAESLSEKASFRGPWRHHRCLLPASAFLEKGEKVERRDGRPFWLARSPACGSGQSLTLRIGSDDDRLRLYWADGQRSDLSCSKEGNGIWACG